MITNKSSAMAAVAATWWAGWLDGSTKWGDPEIALSNLQPNKKEEFKQTLQDTIEEMLASFGECRIYCNDQPKDILAEAALKTGVKFNPSGPFPQYTKTKVTRDKIIVSMDGEYKKLGKAHSGKTKAGEGK